MTELMEIPASQADGIHLKNSLKIIASDDHLFDAWLDARQKFMESQGWHYGADFDEYDDNPETLQILNVHQDGIESGLRLTPRDSIEDTMTWSWLPSEIQTEARKNMPTQGGRVWDLTRLVPGDVLPERAIDSVVELFGAGFELTGQLDQSPRWVFATTVPFYRRFNQQGISFTPLARGRFSPADKHESVLCYADPTERTDFLNHHSNGQYETTRLAVERGRSVIRLLGINND